MSLGAAAQLRQPTRRAHAFHAIFIRAPLIESVGPGVEVLAQVDRPGGPAIVAARQGRWLATSFHPELTRDGSFHKYFLELIAAH